MPEAFPAATVVLIRDSEQGLEVLLLRRSKNISFAGGCWVFPGGRIDEADYAGDLHAADAAARRAAVRETQEEAGLRVTEDAMHYFAHWTTPEQAPKRFATWFYICEVGAGSDHVVVDGGEIVEHRWYQPHQAIEDQRAKAIELMSPTFITLVELANCNTVAEALAMYQHRSVPELLPRFTVTDERGVAMLYPGDAGYEQCDQNAAGARHRFWMGDEGWYYEKSE